MGVSKAAPRITSDRISAVGQSGLVEIDCTNKRGVVKTDVASKFGPFEMGGCPKSCSCKLGAYLENGFDKVSALTKNNLIELHS